MILTIGAVLTDKESKKKIIDNHFHNILRLFDVLPNFLSPQVKRWAIIT